MSPFVFGVASKGSEKDFSNFMTVELFVEKLFFVPLAQESGFCRDVRRGHQQGWGWHAGAPADHRGRPRLGGLLHAHRLPRALLLHVAGRGEGD